MAIELQTPNAGQLGRVVGALREWQRDAAPIQLHPGDLGWQWRFGAAALRTWSRDGQLVAIGSIDSPHLLRLTVAPRVWQDDELAGCVVADVSEQQRGVLPAGKAAVEAPDGSRVQQALAEAGWTAGEPWTPLCRDLGEPVEPIDARIELIRPGRESGFTTVHRSARDRASPPVSCAGPSGWTAPATPDGVIAQAELVPIRIGRNDLAVLGSLTDIDMPSAKSDRPGDRLPLVRWRSAGQVEMCPVLQGLRHRRGPEPDSQRASVRGQ